MPNVVIDFIPSSMNSTNLILNGWRYKGETVSTMYFGEQRIPYVYKSPVYTISLGTTPSELIMQVPQISISKDFELPIIPTNNPDYLSPALIGTFRVYGDDAELKTCHVAFYLKGQALPPKDTEIFLNLN